MVQWGVRRDLELIPILTIRRSHHHEGNQKIKVAQRRKGLSEKRGEPGVRALGMGMI